MLRNSIEDRLVFQGLVHNVLRAAKAGDGPEAWPSLRGFRKDAAEFPADIGLSLIEDGDERIILAVFDDTSEREEMAEALEQSAERSPARVTWSHR